MYYPKIPHYFGPSFEISVLSFVVHAARVQVDHICKNVNFLFNQSNIFNDQMYVQLDLKIFNQDRK